MKRFSAHPITLRQLQYIVAVAEERHFRRAAKRCMVAQPSLSAQIAEAEKVLKIKIFERSRKGTWPTKAGQEIIDKARKILVEVDDLLDAATCLCDPFHGQIGIGVIPTIGPYLLPDIDPVLREHYPKLQWLWTENKTEVLLRQLRDGELDVAIMALEADIGDVPYEILSQDSFVLATSIDHPLADSDEPIEMNTLFEERILLLEDGHCFRDQAWELCSRAGIEEMSFRATSLSTLCQMVAGGTGITLLPSMAIEVENRRGRLHLRPISSNGALRTLILCWRKGAAREATFQDIARTLQQHMRTSL